MTKTLTRKQKKQLFRILSAVLFTALALFLIHIFQTNALFSLIIILPVYLYIGYDLLWAAFRDILHGQLFGEKFLMSVATIGALALGETVEAVAVLLFFSVGELFESIATNKARRNLTALATLCPDEATLLQNGIPVQVAIDEVALDSEILVAAGSRVPLDGIIIKGEGLFDFSSLTGESRPIFLKENDPVPSGVLSIDSPVTIQTTHTAEDSSTARILAMMEEALEKKGKHERFITRFSLFYTPFVVLSALVVAFIFPFFSSLGYLAALPLFIHRALTFLVISCPCALVISVPLAFFGASGAAARNGIIFKSTAAIEELAAVKTAYFDKTGTLTSGKFTIVACKTEYNSALLLEYAAACEYGSKHPLAAPFSEIAFDKEALCEQKEIRGMGVTALYRGKKLMLGKKEWLASEGIVKLPACQHTNSQTTLYLALDGVYYGTISLSDAPKTEATSLFSDLEALSVKGMILSGDSEEVVREVAQTLSAKEAHGALLPEDKVAYVKKGNQIGNTLFVGDGINDAPVLATASVGFAMGALGSDAAMESADAVLTDDDPSKVVWAISLSRFSLGIVKQNILFALFTKFAVMLLGALGFASLWLAIFADVGVSVLAILNAIRTLHYHTK